MASSKGRALIVNYSTWTTDRKLSSKRLKCNYLCGKTFEADSQSYQERRIISFCRGSDGNQEEITVLMGVKVEVESTEDPPPSEWSSLELAGIVINPKRQLHELGLYSPGSGEICATYISQSDSAVFRHPNYKYPSLIDPGIKEALLSHPEPVRYGDDGQEYYKALCEEMNLFPCRIFYNGLLTGEINLNYYGVNPSSVRAMANALSYNRTVTTFNLTDYFLNDDACFHLAEMLVTNFTLRTLILAGCHIGPSGMANLKNGLKLNQGLQNIDFSRNKLGDEGGLHFANCIADGFAAPEINLSSNNLGPETAQAWFEVYEYKKNVKTHLNLSWNEFYKPGTATFLDTFINNQVLKELNLSWNSLESARIAQSISKIMALRTIEVVDLSNNRFQHATVSILASGLAKTRKLQTLNLSFNPMSPINAEILLEKLDNIRVKLNNLLLDNVWVKKSFLNSLMSTKKLSFRKDFNVVYGGVLENWTISRQDIREIILKRAISLASTSKKRKVDILLFLLEMKKNNPQSIPVSEFSDTLVRETPLDQDLITALAANYSMPGPKAPVIDLSKLTDYINRQWPEKVIPPTPPPEPEPLPPPPPSKKDKKKKKKK